MDNNPKKKKIVSFNLSHATFSLLDFLTLEGGTDRLSRNFIRNYHSVLYNISEEGRSHMMI